MRITRFEFNQLHDFRPKPDHFSFEELVSDLSAQAIEQPVEASFSEAQLEDARAAAKKQGYNEGFEAGSAIANQEMLQRERDLKLALDTLATQLQETQRGYDEVIAVQSHDIHQFVIAIARKVAGEALIHRPDLAVQEIIAQCLPIIVQKPRLTLEANSSLVGLLTEQLKPMLERAGFDGDVQFRTNDRMEPSDTRLEWSGGHAERNISALWKEIEEMLAHVTFYPEIQITPFTSLSEIKE